MNRYVSSLNSVAYFNASSLNSDKSEFKKPDAPRRRGGPKKNNELRKQSKRQTPKLKLPDGPNPITPQEYEALRNVVTEEDLKVLLATAITASDVCDKYLNTVSSWKLDADLRPVRFSSRFSALWVRHQDSIVWFSVVEKEFIAFSLCDGSEFKVEKHSDSIPRITLPRRGISWTSVQQVLVDEFENDDHVRAISAAVMVNSNPVGEFSKVANELLAAEMRELEARLSYDSPMDEDMMTILSDAKTTDKGKTLYFDCGGGHCAKSTVNEAMGLVTRITKPDCYELFKESSAMLLPFTFH